MTGAAGAMGRAVVAALQDDGLKVVGLDVTGECLRCDVSDVAAVRKAVREIGPVDVLVNNAGILSNHKTEATTTEEWRKVLAANLDGVFYLAREVIPGMKARRWGRIVNVTSIAVKQPVDNLILSNSVRAAVTGFARTLANEVAPLGITVNNVMPGYTRTARVEELAARTAALHGTTPADAFAAWERQIPMGRLGEPAEFGAMVAFLCSAHASYTTGASIPVDGGWIRSLL